MINRFKDSFLLISLLPLKIRKLYNLLKVARSAHPTKHTALVNKDNFSTLRYKYQILAIAFPLLEDKDFGGRLYMVVTFG